jgi:hypothetical protein
MQKGKKLYNKARGEVPIVIAGEEHILRFTLGAIREVKDYFGAKTIQEIVSNKEYDDLEKITVWLAAGLKRGSMPDATLEQMEEMLLLTEIQSYTEAINRASAVSATGDKPHRVLSTKADGGTPAAPLPTRP